MSQATQPTFARMAFVFDFDETLAEDSFSALLRGGGFDPETFKAERVAPLVKAGWEKALARSYTLVRAAERGEAQITAETVAEVGRTVQIYSGVPEMFGHLREVVARTNPEVDLEFYLLTSGFADIPRACPIAHEFHRIFGGEFYFAASGKLAYLKKAVSHAEKVHYLQILSKGLSEEDNNPAAAYRPVPENELYLPLSQIVYVGDGSSDIPAFDLLHQGRGTALALYSGDDPEAWDNLSEMRSGRSVQNLLRADYAEDSALMRALTLAAEAVCKRIALRQLGAVG